MTKMMLGCGESSTGNLILMCLYMEKRYRPAMKNHVLRRAEDLLNCFVSDTHCKQ